MTDVTFTEPDHYGQAHPLEDPHLIATKLQAFEAALAGIPPKDKENVMEAETKCPELLTTEFKLQFLRCEVFNEKLAAKRFTKYWDKRVSVFGPEKAFQPLTQSGALKDDMPTFDYPVLRLVVDPETGKLAKDPSGRSIVFLDPSQQDKTKYTTESMVRCIWYTLTATLEDEDAQKHGVIFMVYPHNAKFAQFNRQLGQEVTSSIKGCLPLRLSAFHVIQPPTFFKLIFPILKMFLGERLRKRIRIESGSEQNVQKELAKLGITKETLPSDLGGPIVLNQKKWLQERASNGL